MLRIGGHRDLKWTPNLGPPGKLQTRLALSVLDGADDEQNPT